MARNTDRTLEIGRRIARLREQRALTQQQLAVQLCVKRETVNQWENGARQIKGQDIADLADALHTTCDYILRGISSENLDVHRATGLSENSINYLSSCKECGMETAKVIDVLIEEEQRQNRERGSSSVMQLLHFLFAYDAAADAGGKVRVDADGTFHETEDTAGLRGASIALDAALVENAVLLEIQNALLRLKERLP